MLASGALFLYVLSMAFALLYGGFRRDLLFHLCAATAGGGFILQTLHLAASWGDRGFVPVTTLPEVLDGTAWALVLVFFVFGALHRQRILVFFMLPLIVLFLMTAGMVPQLAKEVKPYYYTPWFTVHILLLVVGMALFLYAFLYSTVFIMQDHSLRHRRQPLPLGLPSLEESGRWATRSLVLGYVLFTGGLFSSALYGFLHRGQSNWRPGLMEFASVAAWLLLSAALYGWITAQVNPRRRAWLVVAGAASIVLIILGFLWH